MSSRRGSAAVATAGPSRSDSPLSSTAPSHDDAGGVIDDGAASSVPVARHGRSTLAGHAGDSSRGSSVLTNSSYIQRVPQLDIAFLHAVSTHRPLGPHKHFNLIPVLIMLDRTARQVGADIRDGSASEANTPPPQPLPSQPTPGDDEGVESVEDGRRRSRSISRRVSTTAIKREDDYDSDAEEHHRHSVPPSLTAHIDADMVWQRLDELYDVDGLEDLEYQAVEADDKSPLAKVPAATFVSLASRKALGKSLADAPVAFGFGSSLVKFSDAQLLAMTKAGSGTGATAGRKKTKAVSKSVSAADDEEDLQHTVEFELGPWDEFESLIAPRRLKSYAPSEHGHLSESDGELSELEDDSEGNTARGSKIGKDEKAIPEVDDEEEEEGDEGEDEGDEGEGDDQDGEEDEEEEAADDEDEGDETEAEQSSSRAAGKRKGTGASTKAMPVAQRQKRSSGAGGPSTASPTSVGKRSSRSSAAAANPRRSTRR